MTGCTTWQSSPCSTTNCDRDTLASAGKPGWRERGASGRDRSRLARTRDAGECPDMLDPAHQPASSWRTRNTGGRRAGSAAPAPNREVSQPGRPRGGRRDRQDGGARPGLRPSGRTGPAARCGPRSAVPPATALLRRPTPGPAPVRAMPRSAPCSRPCGRAAPATSGSRGRGNRTYIPDRGHGERPGRPGAGTRPGRQPDSGTARQRNEPIARLPGQLAGPHHPLPVHGRGQVLCEFSAQARPHASPGHQVRYQAISAAHGELLSQAANPRAILHRRLQHPDSGPGHQRRRPGNPLQQPSRRAAKTVACNTNCYHVT